MFEEQKRNGFWIWKGAAALCPEAPVGLFAKSFAALRLRSGQPQTDTASIPFSYRGLCL